MRIATICVISGAVGLSISCVAAHTASPVLGTQVTTSMVSDANGDGVANAKDLAIVQQNLGKAGTRAQGDFDGNGFVDSKDLDLLNTYFGRKQPAAFFGKI